MGDSVNDLVVRGGSLGWVSLRSQRPYEGFGDAFKEVGLLNEFINIVHEALIVVKRYWRSLPPALIRTFRIFIYDSLGRLDEFRRYRGCVGRMMDYAYEELLGRLRRVLGEAGPFGGG